MKYVLLLCLLMGVSYAEITFTDDFWSTTFADCDGVVRNGVVCDGLEGNDAGYPDDDCDGKYSLISAAGNMEAGEGGNGLSVFMQNERNEMSAGAKITFPEPVDEFWLRYYYRIPEGQYMGGINEHKILYAFTPGNVAANVNWPGGDLIMLQPRNTMGNPDIYYGGNPDYNIHNANGNSSLGNWQALYGDGPAAGSWHMFEFHFAMGASNEDIFQMWVDGINVVDDFGLDLSGGEPGWEHVNIPSNHNVWMLDGCLSHDVDDIAVALPGYSGFTTDEQGRQMIGSVSQECLMLQDLIDIVDSWLNGNRTIEELSESIKAWKNC